MEKFDDTFGDLSQYKMLSFEEVSRAFEGNKNPLQEIENKSFEEKSNDYSLKSPLGEKSLFYKKLINKIIYEVNSTPVWRYRVENSTKGTELISNYTKYDKTIDSSKGKYDEETDFVIYIEEQNSINGYKIDIDNVCLIKMSQAMLDEYNEIVKRNADSTVLEDWSSIIIQQQKDKNNIIFTKEKLLEAFKLEIAYRQLKKFSVGNKKYTSSELTDAFLNGISSTFRTLKFEEESWNYLLKSENYLFKNPEKAIVFLQNKISISVNLLKKLEAYFYLLEHLFSFDKTLIKTLRLLINLFKKNLQIIESLLEAVKEYSSYYFAFICGIWDGLVEFIAGFLDIILLMFKFYFHLEELDAEDKIIYLKLKEFIEEFAENYIQDPDFISKAIGEAIVNYTEERYSENQNGYVISHNAGEDFIIGIDIIFSIVEVIKSIADVGKVLPKMEKWIDNAFERNPNLERKLDDVRKPKELPEEPIRERQIEEVVLKPKKKLTPKERAEAKNKAIQEKVEERKTKWIRDKNLKNYLELRKQHLKLSKKEILDIWRKTIDPKNLRKSDLKKFYSSMLNKYPELKGNNFAVFKTSIYKEGKVVDEVTEMVHSGKKKLYDDFLDTVEDQKFKENLIDFDDIPRKNDSEVKYIFNFIQKHVHRGDYFVIETTNVFIACDSCKRELITLKKMLGDKVKIRIKSVDHIKGTQDLEAFLDIKK